MFLGRLFPNVTRAEFARNYWDQKPVHHRAQSDSSARCAWTGLDTAKLRELLPLLKPGLINAHYHGHNGSTHSVTINASQVDDLFRAGLTIEISRLESVHRPVATFLAQLKAELNYPGPILAKIFFSPKGHGFNMHFDIASSLTLQLEGTKRWRHGRTQAMVAPLEGAKAADLDMYRDMHPWANVRSPDEDNLTVTNLSPGDAFYMPPGVWHEAAADDYSLALSFVFAPIPFSNLIERTLARHIFKEEKWRMPLRPSEGSEAISQPKMRETAERYLSDLREKVAALQPEEICAVWSEALGRNDVEPEHWLSPHDSLQVIAPLSFTTDIGDDGSTEVVLSAPQAAVSVGLDALPFLEHLVKASTFQAEETVAWGGSDCVYTWEQVQAVLEGLVDGGLLKRA